MRARLHAFLLRARAFDRGASGFAHVSTRCDPYRRFVVSLLQRNQGLDYSSDHRFLASPHVHTHALNSACNDQKGTMRQNYGKYLQLLVHWKAMSEHLTAMECAKHVAPLYAPGYNTAARDCMDALMKCIRRELFDILQRINQCLPGGSTAYSFPQHVESLRLRVDWRHLVFGEPVDGHGSCPASDLLLAYLSREGVISPGYRTLDDMKNRGDEFKSIEGVAARADGYDHSEHPWRGETYNAVSASVLDRPLPSSRGSTLGACDSSNKRASACLHGDDCGAWLPPRAQ